MQVLSKLLGNQDETPVSVLTGDDSDNNRLLAFILGEIWYFPKSIHLKI